MSGSECHITGDTVVKTYHTSAGLDRADREIEILKRLRGYDGFPQIKNITKCATDGTIKIAMNYLGEPIQHQDNNVCIRKIMISTLRLLKVLHSKNIIHADLKPDNILINDCNVVSIIDFGHSVCTDTDTSTSIKTDTHLTQNWCYRAPEKLVSYKMDIWSLGCVYYELLTDKILFDVDTEKEFQRMLERKEHIKLMNLFHLKQIDQHILQQMLEIDPTKRASIETLIDLFTGVVSPV